MALAVASYPRWRTIPELSREIGHAAALTRAILELIKLGLLEHHGTAIRPTKPICLPRTAEAAMSAAEQFGRNVFMARRLLGLSQETLASFAGVHRQEVGLVERGRREPRLTTILKLTQALGVEPNELLKGINPHKPRRSAG